MIFARAVIHFAYKVLRVERLGEHAAAPGDDGRQSVFGLRPDEQVLDPLSQRRGSEEASVISSEDIAASGFRSVTPKHLLSFTNALALVIGLQIGSGIFAAPSQVSQHVTSPVWGVSAWSLGGLLVWTGAASFIELGLAMPRNGGIQEYLHFCYGDFPAFLFSWVWVIVVKPCAMAMVVIVFSDNLCRGLLPEAWLSAFLTKLIALAGLSAIVFINCLGAKTGAFLANGFLILKLLAVLSVASLGLSRMIFGDSEIPDGNFTEDPKVSDPNIWPLIGNYVTAVFGVLFCYGGWETVRFIFPFKYIEKE
jgi:L-type amino acid transporter 6